MGLSQSKSTTNLSNSEGERGCDGSTIEPDNNIATITNVTINQTQQSTNKNGSKELAIPQVVDWLTSLLIIQAIN